MNHDYTHTSAINIIIVVIFPNPSPPIPTSTAVGDHKNDFTNPTRFIRVTITICDGPTAFQLASNSIHGGNPTFFNMSAPQLLSLSLKGFLPPTFPFPSFLLFQTVWKRLQQKNGRRLC